MPNFKDVMEKAQMEWAGKKKVLESIFENAEKFCKSSQVILQHKKEYILRISTIFRGFWQIHGGTFFPTLEGFVEQNLSDINEFLYQVQTDFEAFQEGLDALKSALEADNSKPQGFFTPEPIKFHPAYYPQFELDSIVWEEDEFLPEDLLTGRTFQITPMEVDGQGESSSTDATHNAKFSVMDCFN